MALTAAVPAQAVTLFLLNFGPEGVPDGSVNIISDTAFDLTGGNNGNEGFTQLFGTADMDYLVSGSWSYVTQDTDGPSFDPAGYFVNSSRFAITEDGNGNSQSGSFSFNVLSGDLFGFYVYTTDGGFGSATLSVSNLSPTYEFGGNAVPEPESWAMLIAGFGLVGATLRRRRQTVAA